MAGSAEDAWWMWRGDTLVSTGYNWIMGKVNRRRFPKNHGTERTPAELFTVKRFACWAANEVVHDEWCAIVSSQTSTRAIGTRRRKSQPIICAPCEKDWVEWLGKLHISANPTAAACLPMHSVRYTPSDTHHPGWRRTSPPCSVCRPGEQKQRQAQLTIAEWFELLNSAQWSYSSGRFSGWITAAAEEKRLGQWFWDDSPSWLFRNDNHSWSFDLNHSLSELDFLVNGNRQCKICKIWKKIFLQERTNCKAIPDVFWLFTQSISLPILGSPSIS